MAQASSVQREPSMEEILASIRRIIEDSEGERRPDTGADAAGGEVETFRAELKPASEPPAESAAPEEEAPAALEETAWRDHEETEAAQLEAEEAIKAASNDSRPPELSAWRPDPQPDAAERAPLVSEHSGRKVAAAFEELGEAFMANRQRKLEEAAEAMLRPMLQEWLDNNLPRLVERLVREEIERIARGD